MADNADMARNKAALEHCNFVYKLIFFILAPLVAGVIVYTFYEGIVLILAAKIADLLGLFSAGLVFIPLSVGALLYSGYRRNDLFAYISPLINLAGVLWSFLLGSDASYYVLPLGAVLIFALPTLLANSRYRYLEEQEGFPHFSELLMEQLKKSDDFKKNDPFEEAAKRYKKQESNEMKDLDFTGETIQEKVTEKNNFMDEI